MVGVRAGDPVLAGLHPLLDHANLVRLSEAGSDRGIVLASPYLTVDLDAAAGLPVALTVLGRGLYAPDAIDLLIHHQRDDAAHRRVAALMDRYPPKVTQYRPAGLAPERLILRRPGRSGCGRTRPGDPPWTMLHKRPAKANEAGRRGTAAGCSGRSHR